MSNTKEKIARLCISAVFAAVLAVCAWVTVPFFGGVSLTLQTFAVALCGYFLGAAVGTTTLTVYILLGVAGLPVFSGFGAGVGVLAGPTGGFLLGFYGLLLLCAVARKLRRVTAIALGAVGIIPCHLCGIVHFSLVADVGLQAAFVSVSLPYIIKDAASVVAAYATARLLERRLKYMR